MASYTDKPLQTRPMLMICCCFVVVVVLGCQRSERRHLVHGEPGDNTEAGQSAEAVAVGTAGAGQEESEISTHDGHWKRPVRSNDMTEMLTSWT